MNINRDSEGEIVSTLGKIQHYLRRTEMPPTKFGRLAVNDPRLVRDLIAGRQLGERITRRIERFLDAQPEQRP